MLVERDGKILLIGRNVFPIAFSLPAGHVDDGETYEQAAARELKEEVGLGATKLVLLIEGRKENKCSREEGTWHYWNIYRAEADGAVKRDERETTSALWYSPEEIQNLPAPGLEPVMHEWFMELGII